MVPHHVRVHLEEPTTFDAMSTPALSGSMVLFVSAGHAEGSGGRSPNCLWNKKKEKKGADLLLNWSHWVDREYQVIELIHAEYPCPEENDLLYCLAFSSWSRARMWQECRQTHPRCCYCYRPNGLWQSACRNVSELKFSELWGASTAHPRMIAIINIWIMANLALLLKHASASCIAGST